MSQYNNPKESSVKKLSKETFLASSLVVLCLIPLFLLSSGCEENESPIPQEQSEVDLESDPDQRYDSAARLAVTEDPNPDAERDEWAGSTSRQPLSGSGSGRYDRGRALEYIRLYAKSPNRATAYCAGWGLEGHKPVKIPADCTNFASQVLWYGGMAMDYTHQNDTGWWYTNSCEWWGSSASWRTVNGLVVYLTTISGRAQFARSARELKIGDLIFYRLRRAESGYRCDAGNLFNHTAIVSGFDGRGEPLVSYHSNEAEDVLWNTKNGSSKALGEACATGFVHILD